MPEPKSINFSSRQVTIASGASLCMKTSTYYVLLIQLDGLSHLYLDESPNALPLEEKELLLLKKGKTYRLFAEKESTLNLVYIAHPGTQYSIIFMRLLVCGYTQMVHTTCIYELKQAVYDYIRFNASDQLTEENLFILFGIYYDKEELANLFYPLWSEGLKAIEE